MAKKRRTKTVNGQRHTVYYCDVCEKELLGMLDRFYRTKGQIVSQPNYEGTHEGMVLCGPHGNFLNALMNWMKKWHKEGANEEDPLYIAINEEHKRQRS